MARAIAIDLGASSGRVMLITLSDGNIELETIHRFSNHIIDMEGLHWDLPYLRNEIQKGLDMIAFQDGDSISVDTWGVDYVLLDDDGNIVSEPFCYRDSRTEGASEEAGPEDLYMRTGIQIMDINTIFQLMREKRTGTVMFLPDYFLFWLSGMMNTELSIASTSGLLDPYGRTWDMELIREKNLGVFSFLPVTESGNITGRYVRNKNVIIISGCGHDTEAAIAAVPALSEDFMFLSCGTWSLMGTEISSPIITADSMKAGFTNEAGYGEKTAFMKNIVGLWILQCIKDELGIGYQEMEELAMEAEPFQGFIDTDHPVFSPPGPMIERIRSYLNRTGQKSPDDVAGIIRIVNESLAMKYRLTRDEIERCTGRHYGKLYIVGGGSKSEMLCSFTAEALGIPVIAGPSEATAYGNAFIQLIARGEVKDISEARKIIAGLDEIHAIQPGDGLQWDAAYRDYMKLLEKEGCL